MPHRKDRKEATQIRPQHKIKAIQVPANCVMPSKPLIHKTCPPIDLQSPNRMSEPNNSSPKNPKTKPNALKSKSRKIPKTPNQMP